MALARAGADVVFSYRRDVAAATKTAQEIEALGRRATVAVADMGDEGSIHQLVATAVGAQGGIDILVCSAGMHWRTPFLDISAAEWDAVLGADLRGPFLLSQAVARQMIAQGDGGRIIAISSISADVAYPDLAHYQVAKAGVRMLVRGMALELAPHGILCNAVAPGIVETDLTRGSLADSVTGPRRRGRIPLGRAGQPEDIAAAVAFLASEEMRWMTGATITVDGGQTVW
ncbi:MAG: SDR family oxidoreductase [Thermomicrobiales bacterium]|nr:SDR family oxidoreductase [Thermomicrobiales bacterium]